MWELKNRFVFYGISCVIGAYLLYMTLRKRKGERPGAGVHEPEL